MTWIDEHYKELALIAVGILTIARPLLIAWGVPEATIDQLIAFLANISVAVVRSTLPVASRGYTYTATGIGAAGAAAGLVGLVHPPTALAIGSIGFALSGLGFNRAVRELHPF